ncbi:hypothetical protein MR818_00415, partial [bacterium]|nr:hypothetical protein [bacterium]
MNTQKNFSFATKKTVLKGKHLPIGLSFLSYKTTDLQYSILPSEEDIMLSFSAQMKSFAKQKLPLHPTIFLALRCLKNSTQKHQVSQGKSLYPVWGNLVYSDYRDKGLYPETTIAMNNDSSLKIKEFAYLS